MRAVEKDWLFAAGEGGYAEGLEAAGEGCLGGDGEEGGEEVM